MKDQKLPLFRVLLMAVFLLCISWQSLIAQSNPEQKNFVLITNTVLIDTIESLSQYNVTPISQPNQNYLVNISSLGNNQFEIEITFDANFVGHKDITFQYWTFNGWLPTPGYVVFSIDVVPSLVIAKDDIIMKTGDTMTIHPLLNDFSSTNSHQLVSVNQTKYGSTTFAGDSINYIGTGDEDVVLYSIKDSLGTADQGMILITSEDLNFVGNDTIQYMIINAEEKYLIVPNSNFSVTGQPLTGEINALGGLGYAFVPDAQYTGVEEVLFEDGNGNSRLFKLTILETVTDLGYIKDDEFNTPMDEAITFNVYQNDLLQSGILMNYSAELTVMSPGVFSYIPPAGFKGTKTFTYKKNFGIVIETGVITINVGNQEPTKAFPYEFEVLAGKDFNIVYDVPVGGYSFNILNAPAHGVAQTYGSIDTINGECASATNNIGIHYTPDANYNGLDEFDIEYCINGAQCTFYKLRFNVVSPVYDSLCNCIENCVWEGDANNDGRVSVTDLLSVGRYMGYGGDTRSLSTQGIWNGDAGNAWNHYQSNGKNTMHIDANNDGVVTTDDTIAIVNNYGKIHSLVPEEILVIKDYPFVLISQQTEVDSGDLLVIDLALGNANYPVKDAHGFTFALNIPPSFIDSASFDFQFYENSWFTHQSPTLTMAVHKSEGKVDIGFTRTNGDGISGYGIIGQLSFIVEEDIDGLKSTELLEKIRRSIYLVDARLEDSYGNRFALPDAVANFDVNLYKGGDAEEEKLVLYPNPTDDYFVLHFNGRNIINDIAVYDVTGKMVYANDEVNTQATQVNTSKFHEGIYIVQCGTSQGVITKRVHIQR